MVKKNDTKIVTKKEGTTKKEAKVEITTNVVELKGGMTDVYEARPKRVVEKIDSERIELAKSIIDTWNKIGVVVHENSHDKYTLSNIYVILETAYKKTLLAYK
jgi:hypothetical protein|tara:strand:+ start:671 stop:979 length:309 start_codon:yes stop_codon:yes gene_type:complete